MQGIQKGLLFFKKILYTKGEGIGPRGGASPYTTLVSTPRVSPPPGGSPSFDLNELLPPNKVWFSEVCARLRQGPEF